MADRDPTVISHFLLESILGVGGMGTVYSAVYQRDGSVAASHRLLEVPARVQDPVQHARVRAA